VAADLELYVGGKLVNPFDLPAEVSARDPRAAIYHQASITPSTRRKYRYFTGLYLDYCAATGRKEVPCDAWTLEAFAVYLAEREVKKGRNKGRRGLAPNSIKLAIASVRALHEVVGENLPVTKPARKIIKGHAELREVDRRTNPGLWRPDGEGAPALKLPDLGEMIQSCNPNTNAGLRDRAVLSLGFATMARRHELVGLDVGDLKVVKNGLEVYIHKTKTKKPRTPKLPPWDHMPEMCAIRNVLAWVKCLRENGITSGPLLRGVDRWDHIHGTETWAGRDGLNPRMDAATVELIVARAALAARLEDAELYSPHSMRSGGATAAYEAGADILAIARHGGWADNSPVIFRYIRNVDEWRRNPMSLVGLDLAA
jgi:integrase